MHKDRLPPDPTLSDTQAAEAVVNEDESVSRHPDLWFSDGSVVLRAETTLFRVHISQLVRRSLFFRDLFALPQPAKDEVGLDGTFDGCPLLILHDSAEDLSNLLNALYDGGPYVTLCLVALKISSYSPQCIREQRTRGFPRCLWCFEVINQICHRPAEVEAYRTSLGSVALKIARLGHERSCVQVL